MQSRQLNESGPTRPAASKKQQARQPECGPWARAPVLNKGLTFQAIFMFHLHSQSPV